MGTQSRGFRAARVKEARWVSGRGELGGALSAKLRCSNHPRTAVGAALGQ